MIWALKSVVIDRMSIARIAAGLGVSWHTVNDAVPATGHQLLIADPTRFDGVQVLGVHEHAWRHTRRGDTVSIDLTPVRDGIEIVAMDGFTGFKTATDPARPTARPRPSTADSNTRSLLDTGGFRPRLHPLLR